MEYVWLWGWHTVQAALKKRGGQVSKIYLTKEDKERSSFINSHTKIKPEIIPAKKMDALFGSSHQGIAIYIKQIKFWGLKEWLATNTGPANIVACDLLEDPRNLGAIIRTSAAFGVSAILVTNLKSAPFEGALAKSAAGALEYIPIIQVVNLSTALQVLQQNYFSVFGLDEGGQYDIADIEKVRNTRNVIVLGQEGAGLRKLTKQNCDATISISTRKEFPTLNVSVAAGIAISRFLGK